MTEDRGKGDLTLVIEKLTNQIKHMQELDKAHQKIVGSLHVQVTKLTEENNLLTKQLDNEVKKLRNSGVI
jgi:hypothetical protein|tara:strand:+ start:91 stop:300 length:210 start_codon:yes stop_codon:yes gene_type:complete